MDESVLIGLVLDFTREMNALQLEYYPLAERESGGKKEIYRRYRAAVDGVYARYLTNRKRSCYYALSSPPFFAGVTEDAMKTVEHGARRETVTVYTRAGLLDFQFCLVQREGQWRINSFKQRYRSRDWGTVYQWQYGNF